MKALSVRQPWAWAIVQGLKRIENRSWPTRYRGPLLIHAGLHYDGPRDRLSDGRAIPRDRLEFGALVGMVTVAGCYRLEELGGDDPFAEGPYCWLLEEAIAFPEPIPYKGQLMLFDVAEEVLEA